MSSPEVRASVGLGILASILFAVDCGTSSSSAPGGDGGAAAGAGGAAGNGGAGGLRGAAGEAAGAAGAKESAGATGTGGAGGPGTTGGGGAPRTGGGGAGGARAGAGGTGAIETDAGRDGPLTSIPFTCNIVIGNSTTQQWFDGGFLTYPGIDATHWEMFFVAHHYIDAWADPNDSAWSTPLDMGRACARDATTPDRVIFIVTYAPPYPPESIYETDIASIVHNIEAKYVGVKRIELMTLVRSPGNVATACSDAANNEQSIPAAEDQAITAVAANPSFAGLVFAAPPFYVPSCLDFIADKPQYTTAGAADVAQVYGSYYAAHP